MKSEFWHERWESNQLGFHQQEINPLLEQWWSTLGLESGTPVFVPLCGKSLDMTWLRSQGHPVIGVEISPIAIRDFFLESGIEPTQESAGSLERVEGGGFELYCGDLFELTSANTSKVQAVYDRASLIALPPETRVRYAAHLARILPATVRILLVTIEYDQAKMSGPPHSVPRSEIESLFGDAFEIECLWSSGAQSPSERFRERGLDSWSEYVWMLSREASGG